MLFCRWKLCAEHENLFIKLDLEFLITKSDLTKIELISGHGNEAKIFPAFQNHIWLKLLPQIS